MRGCGEGPASGIQADAVEDLRTATSDPPHLPTLCIDAVQLRERPFGGHEPDRPVIQPPQCLHRPLVAGRAVHRLAALLGHDEYALRQRIVHGHGPDKRQPFTIR